MHDMHGGFRISLFLSVIGHCTVLYSISHETEKHTIFCLYLLNDLCYTIYLYSGPGGPRGWKEACFQWRCTWRHVILSTKSDNTLVYSGPGGWQEACLQWRPLQGDMSSCQLTCIQAQESEEADRGLFAVKVFLPACQKTAEVVVGRGPSDMLPNSYKCFVSNLN